MSFGPFEVSGLRAVARLRLTATARVMLVASAFVLIALATQASSAAAGSIVYVKGGNVWLANTDGSGQYQVTLDGTASDPYESPSQADDGTILAKRGKAANARLYRMLQNGQLLAAPFATAAPGTGPLHPHISPDGRLVAFYFITTVKDPYCPWCIDTAKGTLYSYADRFTDPSVFGVQMSVTQPTWITNSRVLLLYGTQGNYDDVGGGDNSYQSTWFSEMDYIPDAGDWRNLNYGVIAVGKLALVRSNDPDTGGVIWFYDAPAAGTGNPPPKPTPQCQITGPGGADVVYKDLSFSRDAGLLAWSQPDGVHVGQVPATLAGNCAAITEPLVIPGAGQPDLGPANVNPGARPPCNNPGNPTPCGTGPTPGPGTGLTPGPGTGPTPGLATGPTPGPGTVPSLSSARLSASTFRAADHGASIARPRAPVGTTISYRASLAATTTFTVLKPATGHRKGRRCLAGAPRRGQKRCTRQVRVGSFTHADKAGLVRVRFTGRVRGRKLAPGRYQLTLTPKANGKTGRTLTLAFRIVR